MIVFTKFVLRAIFLASFSFICWPVFANVAEDEFTKGMALLKQRSQNPQRLVPEALQVFRGILKDNPTDEKGLSGTIYALTLMGGYGLIPTAQACDEALDFARKLEGKKSVSALAQYSIGRWKLWCERNVTTALPHFEKASSITSDFQTDALFQVATIHLFRNEKTSCKKVLERVRLLTPSTNEQFIWFDLYLGDYESVLKKSSDLLKVNPNHYNALAYRARAFLGMGVSEAPASQEKARAHFLEAEKTFRQIYDSAQKPAYNNFGEYVIAIALTDRARGLAEYRKLETLSSDATLKGKDRPVMSYRLAQIASALHLKEDAETHFAASIKARESTFMWIGIDPVMKRLRETSPFIRATMMELGLSR